MPKYAFFQRPLDASLTEKKMKTLGFPYTPADIEALQGKSEMDAMVAYLQKLGSDIPWRKAAQTTVADDVKNPFVDNKSIIPEGKAIFDKDCAQCHGVDLSGGVGPALNALRKPDTDLFKTVAGGKPAGGMPAFGDTLGKDKAWKVVTFIQSRQR